MDEYEEQTQHVPNGEQGTPPPDQLDLQEQLEKIAVDIAIEYTVSKIMSNPKDPFWEEEHVIKRFKELRDAECANQESSTDILNAQINECLEQGWDKYSILRLMAIGHKLNLCYEKQDSSVWGEVAKIIHMGPPLAVYMQFTHQVDKHSPTVHRIKENQ